MVTDILYITVFGFVPANRLNEYIRHYEEAVYSREEVSGAHERARRSVSEGHAVHLRFRAHGRHFNIRLKRDLSTFADDFEVVDTHDQPINNLDTAHVYQGHLLGTTFIA